MLLHLALHLGFGGLMSLRLFIPHFKCKLGVEAGPRQYRLQWLEPMLCSLEHQ